VGERERLCAGHRGGEFAEHRIFPALEVAEGIAFQDFGLVRVGDCKHFVECRLFVGICLCSVELDHFAEIFPFVIDEVHGLRYAIGVRFAQVGAALAHVFQEYRRREPCIACELLPGECGLGLFLGVVVRDVLAVARVF
jgi:hypothetical protein